MQRCRASRTCHANSPLSANHVLWRSLVEAIIRHTSISPVRLVIRDAPEIQECERCDQQ